MGSRPYFFLAGVVAAAALGAVALRQHHQTVALSAELELLRARQEQANKLQKEHQRLKEALEKLGDLEQLRLASRHASALRASNDKLRLQARNLAFVAAPKDHPVAPIWPKDAMVLPADEWKFSGSDSPRSTLESVLWAAREGEINQLAGLIDFRPGDRDRADQLLASLPPESRAQYPNAESLIATLVAANMPTDYAAVAPYNEADGSDQAFLNLRLEQASGRQQDLAFTFQHSADGWKIDVPAKVIAGFEQQLKSK